MQLHVAEPVRNVLPGFAAGEYEWHAHLTQLSSQCVNHVWAESSVENGGIGPRN